MLARLLFLSLSIALPVAAQSPASQTVDLSSASGIHWQLQPENTSAPRPILVPAGGWRAQGLTADAGIYTATIPVPASAAGHTVLVHFEAVNFGATVFAGPDAAHLAQVATHTNGWLPFDADVTAIARPGTPLSLKVEVQGRNKFRTPAGKFTVPEGASWYTGLADGILRGVSLRLVNPVRVDDIFIITRHNPDTLEAQATVQNDRATAARLSLSADMPGNRHLATTELTVPPHAHTTVRFPVVAWTLGPQSYWWPNVSYTHGYRATLHTLTVLATENNRPLDSRSQTFGFREFKAVGDHYELNGVRVNLRGDNQQEANFGTDAYGIKPGFGPPSATSPGWPQAVDNLERLNFNVMRIHQIPATPYMLSVADQMGLMLVAESALRGSEHMEDFTAGHDVMLAFDHDMVLRDRNHPAIVIWSAANEWADPVPEAQPIIRALDPTRPIIADGVNRDIAPDIINMEHYVGGITRLPQIGGHQRTDRPYGETEAVWANDNTAQGFAWMATSIRTRRALGNADLRNYVLNNAWPNYVPGEGPGTEVLERAVKNFMPSGDPADMTMPPAITDPWHDPHILLMQQCYAPITAADIDFDLDNALSNKAGDWPTVKTQLTAGQPTTRTLAVFNDDLTPSALTVQWDVISASAPPQHGDINLTLAPGLMKELPITFSAPAALGDLTLKIRVLKDGHLRYTEDRMVFSVVTKAPPARRHDF